ncbi:MAG: tetratricopeptide repeat protein [Nitrospinaceae bacterium]
MGALYDEQGKLKEAMEEYLETIELDPDNAAAKNNLEILKKKMGRDG